MSAGNSSWTTLRAKGHSGPQAMRRSPLAVTLCAVSLWMAMMPSKASSRPPCHAAHTVISLVCPLPMASEAVGSANSSTGWIGRCLAHHARAMSMYPEPYFRKLAALLRRAGIGVVSDPQTGPLHARVKELLAEGNLVALGQDDIADAYYPFGRNNMLEVGFLGSHMLWMTTRPEMEKIYDMITVDAARTMNVDGFALAEGNPAHLVVHDTGSVYEALWKHQAPRFVISHGRLVDADSLPGAGQTGAS